MEESEWAIWEEAVMSCSTRIVLGAIIGGVLVGVNWKNSIFSKVSRKDVLRTRVGLFCMPFGYAVSSIPSKRYSLTLEYLFLKYSSYK